MRIWHLQWEKLAAEKDELLEKMKKENAAVIKTSAAEAKAAAEEVCLKFQHHR